MTARSDHGYGNPEAKQLISRPEIASGGFEVAPAPPGQLPYMHNKCGVIRSDGRVCVNQVMNGHDVCLGHSKT